MKKFLFVMMIFLVVVPIATAQDDNDRRENPSVAILRDGDTRKGTFQEGGTAQLYGFNASEGDQITIELVAEDTSSLDTYMTLLGSAGQVLSSNDDDGQSLNSRIEYTIPEDGGYFVLASWLAYRAGSTADESGVEPQDYEITLRGNTVPRDQPNDRIPIFWGDISIGDNLELANSNEEPVYFLRFAAREGDDLEVAMQSPAFDTILYVFDQNGVRIAYDDDGGDDLNSQLRLNIPRDGEYLIFATVYNFFEYFDEIPFYDQDPAPFMISINRAQ